MSCEKRQYNSSLLSGTIRLKPSFFFQLQGEHQRHSRAWQDVSRCVRTPCVELVASVSCLCFGFDVPVDRYCLPSLSIHFNEASLNITIHSSDIVEEVLPSDFKNVIKKANGSYSCSTLELMKLQRRYNDMVDEIFLLSDQLSCILSPDNVVQPRADSVILSIYSESSRSFSLM